GADFSLHGRLFGGRLRLGRREWHRAGRERREIGQKVRQFLGVLDAAEAHLGVRRRRVGREDEVVVVLIGPGVASRAHLVERGAVVEARLGADLAADDVVEFGARLVAGALDEVVAGLAAAGNGLALAGVGAGKQRPERELRLFLDRTGLRIAL